MDLKDLFYFISAVIGILWIAKATEKRLERIKSLEEN